MTDKPDIVVRLRQCAAHPNYAEHVRELAREAADRIEELRFWLTRNSPFRKGDAK